MFVERLRASDKEEREREKEEIAANIYIDILSK